MLSFTSLGGHSVRLKTNTRTLVVFPSGKGAEKEALVLRSAPDEAPQKDVISWPGEYNVSGVTIRGIGHKEGQQVSYVVEAEHVRTAFLSVPLVDWTDPEIEMVGEIDILVLPTEDAKLAQKLIDEFDPRVLLLTAGKDHAATVKVVAPKETVDEYKVKGSLPAEGREVVVLSA